MPDERARRESGGHGDRADRDAVLRRPRRAGSHRQLPRVPTPQRPTSPIIEDHTIRKLATDADLLAPVLARHLDGRPRLPAGIGLRDPRVGGRYLLCSGGLGLAADDRPHFYVLILRAASVGASASWPP